jgi:hypothetical protein
MTFRSPGDKLTDEQLLGEVEDILRSMPTANDFQSHAPESDQWIGRAAAALTRWDLSRSPWINGAVDAMGVTSNIVEKVKGRGKLVALLNQARADLRMSVGFLSVVVPAGHVFDYFDELRRVIETASVEVFFVDPYLDAEFVSRYLPHVPKGVQTRLLGGSQRIASLLPAVDAFGKQFDQTIQVRSSAEIHDRYLFVDKMSCYLSGASFKDGAKKAPAVLTQITDAVQPMLEMFEGIWGRAKNER